MCLVDIDQHFSAERLATLANFADDLMATSPDAQDGDSSDIVAALLGESVYAIDNSLNELLSLPTDIDDEDPDDALPAAFGRESELTDDRARWCGDIFELLRDRERALGDRYPFRIDPRYARIELATVTKEARAYIFYLCCSSLGTVPKSEMAKLTSLFELLSGKVLAHVLPATAEIDHYGTAGGRSNSRFSGSAHQRLTALAGELRAQVLAPAKDFHPRDSGDNGLDIVAWIPMLDGQKGVAAVFVQCACGRRWDGKQYEASYARWKEFLHLTSAPINITCIPHYFRSVGEEWYAGSDVSGILIDRLRALRFLPPAAITDEYETVIEAALSFRLDVN
ncbi:hypothetical protein [Oerskovia enterophila]|nr:hypothetical protein [Oerskovia enterophila]